MRNVVIYNADLGVMLNNADLVTVSGTRPFPSRPPAVGSSGLRVKGRPPRPPAVGSSRACANAEAGISLASPGPAFPMLPSPFSFLGVAPASPPDCIPAPVQVSDVTLGLDKPRSSHISGGMDGHHGITVSFGNDVLVRDFRIVQRQFHDTGVHGTAHVVFHRGWGQDLVMDCHRTAPWGTLWADIRCGVGLDGCKITCGWW